MPNPVKVTIIERAESALTILRTIVFYGRLIGLANKEDTQAILNTDDAARKLFSSESLSMDDIHLAFNPGQRIVVATTNFSTDVGRAVYLSPPIKYCGWESGKKKYYCAENTEISMEEA